MDVKDLLLELERLKHRIDLLAEKCENAKLQAGHAESTVVSERRQWDTLRRDFIALKKEVSEICDDIKKYDKILFNSGQGMILDVDRLKRAVADVGKWMEIQKQKDDKRIDRWLTIIAILISLVAVAMGMNK